LVIAAAEGGLLNGEMVRRTLPATMATAVAST